MLSKYFSNASRVLFLPVVLAACGTAQEFPKNSAPTGLITTPAAYYSSPKAKYLGAKYQENLDRLATRIVGNRKTASLQFANNLASVGGIGFFTHSAAKLADERFLEVVLGAPDVFEAAGDYSNKMAKLFGSYGTELLSILAGDAQIYQDKDVSGYGLNLTWRNVSQGPGGNRTTVERAVVYFPKDRVGRYLRQELNQHDLLSDAIMFGADEGKPMTLVSYRPPTPQPDLRSPIHDETLAAENSRPAAVTAAPVKVPAAAIPNSGSKEPAPKSVDKAVAVVEPQPRRQSIAAAPPVSEPAERLPAQPATSPAPAKAAPARAAVKAGENQPVPTPGPAPQSPSPASPSPASQSPQQKLPTTGAPFKTSTAALPAGATEPKPAANANGQQTERATALPKKAAVAEPKTAPEIGVKLDAQSQTKQESALATRTIESSERKTGGLTDRPKPVAAAQPKAQPAAAMPEREQVAMLKKNSATERPPADNSAARSPRKALEGYVIQLAFNNKADAQRWAETNSRRGHAVSLTETGGVSVRLRVGSFSSREEAERELQKLKMDGLSGIILNLPQAYQPAAVVSGGAPSGSPLP